MNDISAAPTPLKNLLLIPELPQTHSGKIMRRLLRDIAEKRDVGDTTTPADASVISPITAGSATATDS